MFLFYVAAGIAAVFFAPVLGTLFGAFSGWVADLFFHDTIRTVLIALGVPMAHLQLWQIGATLGFVGGFFRSVQTNNKG